MCVYSKDLKKVPPFPRKWFTKMMKSATSAVVCFCIEINRIDRLMVWLYGQSFFLGHLEKYKIFENVYINPKLYIRYVDDIFAICDKNTSCEKFFDHIDNQHPQIKFTVEKSVNNVWLSSGTDNFFIIGHAENFHWAC